MDSLIPNLFVKDINETIDYYQDLGFEVVMTVPEQGDFVWVKMTCGNVSFMFQTFESFGQEVSEILQTERVALLLYIRIKNIRDFYNQVKHKAKIIKDLEKTLYGATEFSIQDNNGFVLTFAENED